MLGDSTFGFPTISVFGCGSGKRADRTQHGSARMQQLLVQVTAGVTSHVSVARGL